MRVAKLLNTIIAAETLVVESNTLDCRPVGAPSAFRAGVGNLRLLDMRSTAIWKTHQYLSVKYYNSIFDHLSSIFGSTYFCEPTFPSMNFIKNKLRSQLNDNSLDACLKFKITVSFLD